MSHYGVVRKFSFSREAALLEGGGRGGRGGGRREEVPSAYCSTGRDNLVMGGCSLRGSGKHTVNIYGSPSGWGQSIYGGGIKKIGLYKGGRDAPSPPAPPPAVIYVRKTYKLFLKNQIEP